MKRLFKVKVETEIMVMADSPKEAVKTALLNAPNEIGVYGKGDATPINSVSDISEDWKTTIPYCQSGLTQESKKCYEIALEYQKNIEKGLDEKDINEIVRIRNESKQSNKEVIADIRPDPKPKELNWQETRSGRPLPTLRFKL